MPDSTDLPEGYDTPGHLAIFPHLRPEEQEMFAALLNPDVTVKVNTRTGTVDVADITRKKDSPERKELAALHMYPKASVYSPEGVYALAMRMAIARRERDALWAQLSEEGVSDEDVYRVLRESHKFDTKVEPREGLIQEMHESEQD